MKTPKGRGKPIRCLFVFELSAWKVGLKKVACADQEGDEGVPSPESAGRKLRRKVFVHINYGWTEFSTIVIVFFKLVLFPNLSGNSNKNLAPTSTFFLRRDPIAHSGLNFLLLESEEKELEEATMLARSSDHADW